MIVKSDIEPVLDQLMRSSSTKDNLLFLDALTQLPIDTDVWRGLSAFAIHVLRSAIKEGIADASCFSVLARVPLQSVRHEVRSVAQGGKYDSALIAALALSEQHDPGGRRVLLADLARAPKQQIAFALACLPERALQTITVDLKSAMSANDAMVRLWLAIALAKAHVPGGGSGDLEPLEQLWDSLVRPPDYFQQSRSELYFREPPPLFWGDPSLAADMLRSTRPLPPHVVRFLLGLKENDFEGWMPRSESVASAREAKVLIAGLTGAFDIDGEMLIDRDAAPVPKPADAGEAHRIAQHLLDHPWHGLDVNASGAELAQLHAAPPELAAQVAEHALAELTSQAKQLGDAPKWAIGNALLYLITALPSQIPLRVGPILENEQIAASVPTQTLAWSLARAGASVVWQSLIPHIVQSVGAQRHEWLVWLRDIAGQLHASAPFAGAGGSAAESKVLPLIDDLPRAARPPAAPRPSPGAPAVPPPPSAAPPSPSPMPSAPPMVGSETPAPDEMPMSASIEEHASVAEETSDAARYIQGDLYRQQATDWIASNSALALRARYKLTVFIGPPGVGSFQAAEAFPDDALDWQDADRYRLQVVFAVLDQRAEAQVGTLELPRTGTSTTCSFEFEPLRSGPLRMRISILFEGRILQTAIIDVEVHDSLETLPKGTRVTPELEMLVHHDWTSLRDRRRFDASLLLNHTAAGASSVTAASHEGAYISSLDASQAQLQKISELLQDIANKSKLHTKGLRTPENSAWLTLLAREGHYVYRNLVLDYIGRSAAADRLGKAKYLQIVTARPDAVVPLEFVYEYPYPKKEAKLCDHAEEALKSGHCSETCSLKKHPNDFVCPMGFWGLSRVIERHVHDPTLAAPAIIKAEENTPARKQLELKGPSLLAASDQVPKAHVTALNKQLKKFWRSGVAQVKGWPEWLKAIEKNPVLFVVLPHSHGEGPDLSLEINGDSIESALIDRLYIYPQGSTGSPPIVLLLGCNTAGVAEMHTYAKHITVFRQAQCAIVLATTAAVVWGADIAKVAEELLVQLQAAAESSEDCFGDILQAAKRNAVLDSQLVAVCLAAIGDADWRIKIPHEE